MTRVNEHQSVLLKEAIDGLDLKNDSFVIDATFGGGGHSREILKRYKESKILALDQDKSAWTKAKAKFKGQEKRIIFTNINFRDIKLRETGSAGSLKNKFSESAREADAILFDLGLSSIQLDNGERGFSFLNDEPILMTFKENPSEEDLTASDVVNSWSEENLTKIILGYGEEKYAKRIARGICEARKSKKIEKSRELAEIIENSVPIKYKKGRIHPATKTFQAIRIAVNDELRALSEGLEKAFGILRDEGRMAVISFHSGEDRIVKRFFKKLEKEERAVLINKKPIIPSEEEIENNKRARSAKLRILEKTKI